MQDASLANRTARPTEGTSVNWRKANRQVRNLRQRIFRATQEGDWDKVQSLQRLMLRSYANTLVSVRRVTQVNQGQRTAGVDKLVVKTPERRGQLVDHLMTFQPWRARPAKRGYIPKANGKLRPLGIPTIIDRCLQARVKNALEPCWEGHGPFPARELIRQWLKAGYVERGVWHATESGTGQGAVVSPLLASIALHGLETALGIVRNARGHIKGPRTVIRYADDFVVFCETKDDATRVIALLTDWLGERGLALSADKTRIVHLTEGFDFLGFTVRRYAAPCTRTGYKLLITPSAESVKRLRTRLRAEWRALAGQPAGAIVKRLNPLIRGWANYFRIGVATKTFSRLDHWMVTRELRYVQRKHPRKSHVWRKARYWDKHNRRKGDTWVFGDKQTGAYLLLFRWFKIERHILVRGTASPDDPRLREYWTRRRAAQAKDLRPSLQKIAKNQSYVCSVCGETLFNDEEIHTHHLEPRAQGGRDGYTNLALTHLYCHQQIHSRATGITGHPTHVPTRQGSRPWLA